MTKTEEVSLVSNHGNWIMDLEWDLKGSCQLEQIFFLLLLTQTSLFILEKVYP